MNRMEATLRRLVFPSLLMLAVVLSVGCGNDEKADTAASLTQTAGVNATPGSSSPIGFDFDCAREYAGTEPEEATFPVEAADETDNTLKLEEPPTAIVSLSAGHTEMLFAIGAGGQVIAGDNFSDCPANTADIQHIDSFDPSVEAIVALKPDLVIITFDPGDAVRPALEGAGIPVFFLNAPESVEGVYAQIEQLGRVTGHAAEATALTAGMNGRIQKVVETARGIDVRPSVFHEVDTSYYSAGPGSFVGDLYDILRVENIANVTGEAFPLMTEEAIIAGRPEVIILADEDAGESPETVKARAGWGAIPAVQNNRIFAVDPDIISRPGPRLVEAIETLARLLYPEDFD